MMPKYVIVSRRQMRGSAPERRTFHRLTCPSLKTRDGKTRGASLEDTQLSREDAVAARYKPCERCRP
jgi:methylphosphotriester-DNA--protein-cysteine methyltransferase